MNDEKEREKISTLENCYHRQANVERNSTIVQQARDLLSWLLSKDCVATNRLTIIQVSNVKFDAFRFGRISRWSSFCVTTSDSLGIFFGIRSARAFTFVGHGLYSISLSCYKDCVVLVWFVPRKKKTCHRGRSVASRFLSRAREKSLIASVCPS